MKNISIGTVLVLLSAYPVAAQSKPPTNESTPPTSTQNTQATAIIPQVRQNLEQSGFTSIKIIPESLLVNAKDKNGNSVMMVINPNSFSAVTEIEPDNKGGSGSGGGAGGQTGSTVPKSK